MHILHSIGCRVSSEWLSNAAQHLVWKLSSFGRLNLRNLVYHLVKRSKKEGRSFLQQVEQSDEQAACHFVGIVAGIDKDKIVISDGWTTVDYLV
jgi:hypothetical protein